MTASKRSFAVATLSGLALAGAIAAVGFGGRAFAQDGALERRFTQLDRNSDQKVTADELADDGLFKRLDLNGDGAITLPEARLAVAQGALNPPAASKPPTEARDVPAPSADVDAAVREGPEVLKPGERGVGRLVPDVAFTDIAGKPHTLSDFRDYKAVVIAMTGTGCPLCQKYAPSLAAMEKCYRERGVAFVFVNPNASEEPHEIRKAAAEHGFAGPYVQDGDKKFVRALEAGTTTEVFILDSARTLVYRGAVDDQYGFAYSLDAPRRSFLTDALEALLAGKTPAVAATTSPGCELLVERQADAAAATAVTYHNRVSRIVQANCLECHRRGGVAPMALETYEQVKDYAGMIGRVVDRGIMPPWFAAAKPGPAGDTTSTAHWANDRSLAAQEKADLITWVKAGTPEGDPKDAPLPRLFPDGWLIGKPDAVFEFAEPVKVKATGTMPYQNVTIETDLPEDKWVQAIEVRPGNASVVHHVVVSLRGGSGEVDERQGYWAIYVPGNSTLQYPDGFAKLLPRGAKLRFQMHYTPNGTATEDSTKIGLVFAKQSPRHEVKVAGIANTRIRIPAGADNHQEVATLRLPLDVQVLAFLPHMHLRGKAARYELLTADGTETLLDIPRYDFNWQLLYRLAEPRSLQQGDAIRFIGWFDNSEKNPANPDATRTVRWGPQTDDEMHLGYVEYIVPGAVPGEPIERLRGRGAGAGAGGAVSVDRLFQQLDVNNDGVVTKEEVRQQLPDNAEAAGPIFDRLDRDRNGKLDPAEFAALNGERVGQSGGSSADRKTERLR